MGCVASSGDTVARLTPNSKSAAALYATKPENGSGGEAGAGRKPSGSPLPLPLNGAAGIGSGAGGYGASAHANGTANGVGGVKGLPLGGAPPFQPGTFRSGVGSGLASNINSDNGHTDFDDDEDGAMTPLRTERGAAGLNGTARQNGHANGYGNGGSGSAANGDGSAGGPRGRRKQKPTHNPAQDHLYLEFIQLVAARAALYPKHVAVCSQPVLMTARRGSDARQQLHTATAGGAPQSAASTMPASPDPYTASTASVGASTGASGGVPLDPNELSSLASARYRGNSAPQPYSGRDTTRGVMSGTGTGTSTGTGHHTTTDDTASTIGAVYQYHTLPVQKRIVTLPPLPPPAPAMHLPGGKVFAFNASPGAGSLPATVNTGGHGSALGSPAAGAGAGAAASPQAAGLPSVSHDASSNNMSSELVIAASITRQQYFDHPTVQLQSLNERLIALLAQIRTGWVVRTDALFFIQSIVALYDQTCRSDWILLSDIELIAAASHIEAPRIKTLIDLQRAATVGSHSGRGGNPAPASGNMNGGGDVRSQLRSSAGGGVISTLLGAGLAGAPAQPSARYYGSEFSADDHDAGGDRIPPTQRELQSQFARYVYSLAVALCWSFQIAHDILAEADADGTYETSPVLLTLSDRLVALWSGAPIRLRAVSDLSVVQTLLTWSVNSPYIGDEKDSEWARAFVQALQVSSTPTVYNRCPTALPRLLDTVRHLAGHTAHAASFRTLLGEAHAVEVLVDVLSNSLIDPFQCHDISMIAVAVQALHSLVLLASGNRNASRALHMGCASLVADHIRHATGVCMGGHRPTGDGTDRRLYPLGSEADRARITLLLEGFKCLHALTDLSGAVFEVSLNNTVHVTIQALLRLSRAGGTTAPPIVNGVIAGPTLPHPKFFDVWTVACPLLSQLIQPPKIEQLWIKQTTIAISEVLPAEMREIVELIGSYAAPQNIMVALDPTGFRSFLKQTNAAASAASSTAATASGCTHTMPIPGIFDLLSFVQTASVTAPRHGSTHGGSHNSNTGGGSSGSHLDSLADSLPICNLMLSIIQVDAGRDMLMSRSDAKQLLQPFIEALPQATSDKARFLAICELLIVLLRDTRYQAWFKRTFSRLLQVERFQHLARKHPLSGEQKPELIDNFFQAIKLLQTLR